MTKNVTTRVAGGKRPSKQVVEGKFTLEDRKSKVKPLEVRSGLPSQTEMKPLHAPLATLTMAPEPAVEASDSATSALAAQVKLLAITKESDLPKADAMLVQLKQLSQKIEKERKDLTAPLKATAKKIEDKFRPFETRIKEADTMLRQKVLLFRRELEAKKAAEQAELEEEITEAQKEGDTETALALAQKSVAIDTDKGVGTSTQVRKQWSFRVRDLGKVPKEYFSLDEKKVRAAIKAGVRTLAGLEIFEEETLAVYAGQEP